MLLLSVEFFALVSQSDYLLQDLGRQGWLECNGPVNLVQLQGTTVSKSWARLE